MSLHHTIYLRLKSSPSVLPRILLVFSRRRLQIQALQYFDLDSQKCAELQIDLDCDLKMGLDLVAQLGKIIEVRAVWKEHQAPVGQAVGDGAIAA